jgi:hypothetical protein
MIISILKFISREVLPYLGPKMSFYKPFHQLYHLDCSICVYWDKQQHLKSWPNRTLGLGWAYTTRLIADNFFSSLIITCLFCQSHILHQRESLFFFWIKKNYALVSSWLGSKDQFDLAFVTMELYIPTNQPIGGKASFFTFDSEFLSLCQIL